MTREINFELGASSWGAPRLAGELIDARILGDALARNLKRLCKLGRGEQAKVIKQKIRSFNRAERCKM
jgi:hypothetical protein